MVSDESDSDGISDEIDGEYYDESEVEAIVDEIEAEEEAEREAEEQREAIEGKTFAWKDLSGRGETGTQEGLSILDNEEDENGLFLWLETCEIGDEWSNNANKYTRIS